jgi:hypothetical protein
VEPILPTSILSPPPTVALLSATSRGTGQLWHRRLGHIHVEGIMRTFPLVTCLPPSLSHLKFCSPCVLPKSTIANKSTTPGSRDSPRSTLNLDSWGHVEPSLQGNNQFYGAFCRSTSFAMGRPIRSTAEIVPYTRDIINLVLRMGHKITEIRADNGATFRSTTFATLYSEHNITLRFLLPTCLIKTRLRR